MSPRRGGRPPFSGIERDNQRTFELVVDEERRATPAAELDARKPWRRPLPEAEAPPLSTLELAWHYDDVWLEPYLSIAVERAGGFRPILERAYGAMP